MQLSKEYESTLLVYKQLTYICLPIHISRILSVIIIEVE